MQGFATDRLNNAANGRLYSSSSWGTSNNKQN